MLTFDLLYSGLSDKNRRPFDLGVVGVVVALLYLHVWIGILIIWARKKFAFLTVRRYLENNQNVLASTNISAVPLQSAVW